MIYNLFYLSLQRSKKRQYMKRINFLIGFFLMLSSAVFSMETGNIVDVLSELDSFRQNYLLESIRCIQTIITCTGLDEFISNQFNIDKIFRVKDGSIDREQQEVKDE